MALRTKVIGSACAAVVLGGLAIGLARGRGTLDAASVETLVTGTSEQLTVKKPAERPVVQPVETARKVRMPSGRQKPNFALDAQDESALTDEQHKLIDAIRLALEEERLMALIDLVKQLQASDEWPDGIPVPIRKAAIDALAWFGKDGLPEVIGFMADSDPEILETAIEAFDDGLQDANGDAELSMLVITACQAVNDADAIESFLMELGEMRNSVAVETIKAIAEKGTQAAKEALQEAIDDFTCEEGITLETLDAWLKDHPDDPDDEDVHGPVTEGDDPDEPESVDDGTENEA